MANNLEWSPEDVENYKKFVASKGGKVLKVEGPDLRGDYIFWLSPDTPTISMSEFERSRHETKRTS